MTEQAPAAQPDNQGDRERRIAYGVGAVKWIFLLALLRLLITPMSDELLGDELLPMPTWEWSLFSITPGILIYLLRRPRDWQQLSNDLTIVNWSLRFYLLYGLAFAVLQGVGVLWISVLAGTAGLAGIWRLNRREFTSAT
ncbi:hypothetical protein ACFY3N_27205 [Streptomyces sp. NPDC000348]|uniref:hypothetical protein n=1 Tax=Streptomyces sp. NPDC000348 TaxID=3364538 RepID=UPI00369B751D